MPVIIQYVVERDGEAKMTFASKQQADAYDKMLDTADELSRFLAGSSLISDEQQTEALALYLAQHKDELLVALGAKKPAQKADKAVAAEKATKAKISAVEQAA